MKLYDILNNVTIQGNVRVSIWDGDEEVNVRYFDHVDDLAWEHSLPDAWEELEVRYMFAGTDGFLHIELIKEA